MVRNRIWSKAPNISMSYQAKVLLIQTAKLRVDFRRKNAFASRLRRGLMKATDACKEVNEFESRRQLFYTQGSSATRGRAHAINSLSNF